MCDTCLANVLKNGFKVHYVDMSSKKKQEKLRRRAIREQKLKSK